MAAHNPLLQNPLEQIVVKALQKERTADIKPALELLADLNSADDEGDFLAERASS